MILRRAQDERVRAHPRPLSLRERGEMALFFIFAPFGPVLSRSVSGAGFLVGLCGPFLYCLFCICAGRETSGSLFSVFVPFRSGLSRFQVLAGGASSGCSGGGGTPGTAIAMSYKVPCKYYGRDGLCRMARGWCHGIWPGGGTPSPPS